MRVAWFLGTDCPKVVIGNFMIKKANYILACFICFLFQVAISASVLYWAPILIAMLTGRPVTRPCNIHFIRHSHLFVACHFL